MSVEWSDGGWGGAGDMSDITAGVIHLNTCTYVDSFCPAHWLTWFSTVC